MTMLDFLMISTRSTKRGVIEIYPKFIIKRSSDLMIRGGDFYAIWIESRGLWSTDEQDALQLIDHELDKYAEENRHKFDANIKVLHMWDAETGMIDSWHKYCQRQMRDSFQMLDEHLIFSNTETNKNDFSSKRLSYPLESGDISSYDKLISTLYTEEERLKIEWAIGAIITGDSKKIQKFLVFYGAPGTGKSTILNIVQSLFEGYYSVFDAKALGSTSNAFALEAFKTNPLIAIQHDGDLSRIEDNTRLNSLVSHEMMTVNEKFKSAYTNQFKTFLFMGTNKPVKITDAKSGLIRRLIDVSPSGNKLSPIEYKKIIKNINFELGAIAYHCKDVYLSNPGRYDDYVPVSMLGASNDFYNFVQDSYYVFKKENGATLKAAWEMYKNYCEDAKVPYPLTQRVFKEELRNYFDDFAERYRLNDGTRVRNYFYGFKEDAFDNTNDDDYVNSDAYIIDFKSQPSIFDKECAKCISQYANENETPTSKWSNVKTVLSDLDTSKLHYVRIPENHIVIDFDIPDENGNKSLELNLKEASKWPPTYAELSKGGNGIHLHYYYNGDVSKLSRVYDDKIEVKVFNGNGSLRRRLSKCNNLPIATISSGLPLKEENKVVNFEAINNEKGIRRMIKKNLNKEIHHSTKPSIDFIYKILDDAYKSGVCYDVTDMRNAILFFASNSSHQAEYCIKLVNKMKFKSEEPSVTNDDDNGGDIVFYDVEVFPNLFLVNWKKRGAENSVNRLINPSPTEIEQLLKYKLIGFNCRRYDNHIMYARLMGYTNEQLFNLSQRIISGSKNAMFSEAYNLSYTDVYDFLSAGNKTSLKKWEIKLGLKHHELGLPWDQPVPEELWPKVAEYCDDDVLATEAVFEHNKSDWIARQILAEMAGGTVNDTTNSLSTKFIFGKNRKPQTQFNYRDLSKPVFDLDEDTLNFLKSAKPEMMAQRHGEAGSLLPYFPGYKFDHGKSTYKEFNENNPDDEYQEIGEGGFVFSTPGVHTDVALLDVESMHPNSTMDECLFGSDYTKRFKEIVDARVAIKHEDWDTVVNMVDGLLAPHVERVKNGEITSKDLANALKTVINSVYGLTSAKFDNPFRDVRNLDNIVAKRGALFMVDLKEAVEKLGYTVAHIKTDSIKIPNATPEIIDFVMNFGLKYGYKFVHEATYDRMCLVNKSVYIAKYASAEKCQSLYGYIPGDNAKKGGKWTATGTQFQIPYVFKTLFSKEEIEFEDMCETFSVTSALYLDLNEGKDLPFNEDGSPKSEEDFHNYRFIGKVGQFTPVKDGYGGGELLRQSVDKDGSVKYGSATGAKGFRWLESTMVKDMGGKEIIDRRYYDRLVDAAIESIEQYQNIHDFTA